MGSPELQRAKARYLQDQSTARLRTVENLRPILALPISITSWSRRANEAIEAQWKPIGRRPETAWNWEEIFHRYNDPDRLDIAIWTREEHLSGVGLVTTSGSAVTLRFIEGDPDPGCPLKGKRLLICLETATIYGQLRGKTELRCVPVNDGLAEHLRSTYSFQLERPRKEPPYYRRAI